MFWLQLFQQKDISFPAIRRTWVIYFQQWRREPEVSSHRHKSKHGRGDQGRPQLSLASPLCWWLQCLPVIPSVTNWHHQQLFPNLVVLEYGFFLMHEHNTLILLTDSYQSTEPTKRLVYCHSLFYFRLYPDWLTSFNHVVLCCHPLVVMAKCHHIA